MTASSHAATRTDSARARVLSGRGTCLTDTSRKLHGLSKRHGGRASSDATFAVRSANDGATESQASADNPQPPPSTLPADAFGAAASLPLIPIMAEEYYRHLMGEL